MQQDRFQIYTTRDIHELVKVLARRRGMSIGAFVHRALVKEDPELARLIKEQLGLEV
jgi:hypothetical protein